MSALLSILHQSHSPVERSIVLSSTPTKSTVYYPADSLGIGANCTIAVYSLGIVFFELCNPFKTGMERIQVSQIPYLPDLNISDGNIPRYSESYVSQRLCSQRLGMP